MNYKLLRFLFALTGLGVCAYALYCAWHMFSYIGTGHYWTNAWFWKAHLLLPVMFIIRALMQWTEIKEKQNAKRNLPLQ